MNKYDKFFNFILDLYTKDNSSIVESIVQGFIVCFEAEAEKNKISIFKSIIRTINEKEVKEITDLIPEISFDEAMKLYVVANKDTNEMIRPFPDLYSAEQYAKKLDNNFLSMTKNELNRGLYQGHYLPPSIQQSEESEGTLPEELKYANKKQLHNFLKWLFHYKEETDRIASISDYAQAYLEKYPNAFN